MNKSFLFLINLAVIGILLGNLFAENWGFFLLPIASLALLVISARLKPSDDIFIDVSRSFDEEKEIYIEDEIDIEISLMNKSERSLFIEVKDILPSHVELVKGRNHETFVLQKNEKKDLRYTISCPVTGIVDLGPIEVNYRDPLDFFSKEIYSGEKVSVRVLPKVEEMQSVEINPSYTKHWLGDIKSKNIGVGSEFYSIREYYPGDELRNINWKATAKYMDPMTNEFEAEKSGDVILIVDGYKKGIAGSKKYNTLRSSIKATASLAKTILSARNRVGLIVSGEYLNWVYPGTGRNHYHKLMSNLTQFEKGGDWGLEGVKWLLEDFFPRRSLIIFISPLTVPEFSETIIDLSRKDYDVMVISPDPLKIEKDILGDYDEIAEELYKTQRKNVMDYLWSHNTMVVDWDPTNPLEPRLKEVLKYKRTR